MVKFKLQNDWDTLDSETPHTFLDDVTHMGTFKYNVYWIPHKISYFST